MYSHFKKHIYFQAEKNRGKKKMLRKSCIEGREKKEEFLRLNSGNLVRPGRQVKKKSGGAGLNYICTSANLKKQTGEILIPKRTKKKKQLR